MYRKTSSVNNDNFTSSFSNFIPFYFLGGTSIPPYIVDTY